MNKINEIIEESCDVYSGRDLKVFSDHITNSEPMVSSTKINQWIEVYGQRGFSKGIIMPPPVLQFPHLLETLEKMTKPVKGLSEKEQYSRYGGCNWSESNSKNSIERQEKSLIQNRFPHRIYLQLFTDDQGVDAGEPDVSDLGIRKSQLKNGLCSLTLFEYMVRQYVFVINHGKHMDTKTSTWLTDSEIPGQFSPQILRLTWNRRINQVEMFEHCYCRSGDGNGSLEGYRSTSILGL